VRPSGASGSGAGRSSGTSRRAGSSTSRRSRSGVGSVLELGPRACVRVGPRCGRVAASSRIRPRPRRRSRSRAPPRCFHLRPHLLLPQLDGLFVALERVTGRALRGPAVPVQEPPDSRDRALTWNWRPIRVLTRSSVHRWSSQPCAADPFASSASSRANRSSDSFGSFAGPFDCRPSRPRFSPVAAPLLDRTLAHPQGLGDVRRPVTALEPPAGFHPDPFPRSPPLGSQAAPVIRIPHDTGLP
jgi:hypothetical protein